MISQLTLTRIQTITTTTSLSVTSPPTLTGDANPGARNTAIGVTALDAITEGNDNVALGYEALTSLSTGDANTAIGSQALDSATTASQNTAIGHRAAENFTTEGSNTAVGYMAMLRSDGGGSNTAIGRQTMQFLDGANNTALGANAGNGLNSSGADGDRNVFIGRLAGRNIDNGDDNVFIGEQSANTFNTGSFNIILGSGADVSSATANNELNIGGTLFGNLANDQIGLGVADATAINADAILELDSTSRGLLLPRMTTVQRDAISGGSPTDSGLTIYNTTHQHHRLLERQRMGILCHIRWNSKRA